MREDALFFILRQLNEPTATREGTHSLTALRQLNIPGFFLISAILSVTNSLLSFKSFRMICKSIVGLPLPANQQLQLYSSPFDKNHTVKGPNTERE
jgi:hypothetical protein